MLGPEQLGCPDATGKSASAQASSCAPSIGPFASIRQIMDFGVGLPPFGSMHAVELRFKWD